jgi:transposase
MDEEIMLNKNEQFASRVIEDFRSGRTTRKAAAMLLGVTERTITNMASRVREKGVAGIKHGNTKRRPINKLSPDLKEIVLELASGKYKDYNLAHCLEKLSEHEDLVVGYATFWRWCHQAKIRKPTKRRKSKNHIYRDRVIGKTNPKL